MKVIRLLGLVLLLFAAIPAGATHILGGEITYKCNDQNGMYEFTVVVIRDCSGSTAGFGSNTINLQGPHGVTPLPLIASVDLSPRCSNGTLLRCNSPATGQGATGSYAKFIFRGELSLASVPAPPVGTGHTFWVTVPCCRTPGIVNSMSVNGTQSFTVKMFRYVDPITGNALTPTQMCDNSPAFNHEPAHLYVQNPDDTIFHQQGGFELDVNDSMVYQAAFAISEQRVPYQYVFPYSLTNPIAGLLGAPLVPATNSPVHPVTGEVVFRPTTQGLFVLPIEVKSYRGGQLISEVRRDYTIRIIQNPPSFPPLNVPAAFQQRPPLIQAAASATALLPGFEWEYYAGDSIRLFFNANDYYPTLTGNPTDPSTWIGVQNNFRFAFSGSVVATDQVSGTGCHTPPCAIVRSIADSIPSVPPTNPPVLVSFGNGSSFAFGYNASVETYARFFWNPSCIQVPGFQVATGASAARTYKILLTALDSSCPFEGRSEREMTIKLRNLPLTPAPLLKSLQFDTSALRYTLHFEPRIDTVNIDPIDAVNYARQPVAAQKARSVGRRLAAFQYYRVYRSTTAQGPWVAVGDITNPFDSVFIDNTTFAGNHQVYYQLRSVSGCFGTELNSNTLQAGITTSVLSQSQSKVTLMPNSGRDKYRLQADAGESLPKQWQLRDVQGRLLHTYDLTDETTVFEFDLSQYPNGMYLLQAVGLGKTFRLVHQP